MTVYHGLLRRRLELYLGGVWVDFSARLLTQTLSPNPGRTSGGNRVSPSTLNFNLDNPLGDITPFNATSTYYPHVDVGMLVRWSVYWDGNWYVRGVFEATEVQPHWPYGDLSDGTTTGKPGESYVTIAAADILQRLSDDQRPLQSALFRSMVGIAEGDYVPHAYWSMEDGETATQFASALPGGPTMTFSGTVALASDAEMAGSAPLPTLDGGASAYFTVPAYADTEKWAIQTMVKLTASRTIYDLTATGSARRIVVAYNSGTATYDVDMYDSSGASVYSGDMPATADTLNTWVSITFSLNATTATDFYNFTVTPVGTNTSYGLGDLVSGRYGRLVGGTLMNGSSGSAGVGHHAVFINPNFNHGIDDIYHARAGTGWLGETAGRRLERLCREEGISFTSAGDLDETSPMGPQATGTLYEAFVECEATDLGIFHAQRDANGVHYRTRRNLYNQAAAFVLDAAENEVANPFRPAATSKHIVNDVTVNRPDGSWGRAIDRDSINAVGFRPRDYDANTETDTQLTDIAGWLLNLGTPKGMHYPSLSTELTIASQLIPDWLALALGDRVQVVNLPPQHPTDTVDLLVDGYTEPHSPSRWTPQINCSPASPYIVAVLDDDDFGKLDTDGSELTASVNSSATALTVATLNMDSPLWTTDSGEMPVPVVLAGEVVSATDIASAVRDTFAGSSSNGWGTSDSGHAWTIGAGTASLFSETSGVGRIAISALNTVHHISVDVGYAARQRVRVYNTLAVTPTGAPINWGVLLRYVDASNYYWIDVQVSTAGVLTLRVISVISSVVTQLATATSRTAHSTSVARILIAEIGDDDLIRAKVYANGATEPSDWELVHQASTTDLQTGTRVGCIGRLMTGNTNVGPVNVDFDNFAVLNPQTMTVTRSVNGVVKAQSAGAAVNVYRPARLAL